jgi:hypothetical protein
MNYLKTAALAVLGTIALTVGASAAVICNEDGDCWRTKERLTYPPEARVQIYEDDYTLGPKYRWRDTGVGRGYYRSEGAELTRTIARPMRSPGCSRSGLFPFSS